MTTVCAKSQAPVLCSLPYVCMFRPWAGVTDHLAVGIGTQLLGIVPGRVSTECDAHLSYDTQATIDKVSLSCPSGGGGAAAVAVAPIPTQHHCKMPCAATSLAVVLL